MAGHATLRIGMTFALALLGVTGVQGQAGKAGTAGTHDFGGIWLKGDLHLHSRHSRDSTNNPVAKIVALGESAGMDYLLVSDHDNHVAGDVAHHLWADPEFRTKSILMLYGAEWTTDRGHGNILSAEPYDHKQIFDVRDDRDLRIAAVKKRLGVHLSANHPSGKDHFGFSYDMVDSIEVWNSVLWAKNAEALMIWDDMLKSGRKLTGRGGSDSHHGRPDTPAQATSGSRQATANNVGTPTTWVFAAARTRQAIVDALTAGRASISANPYSPRVELTADTDDDGRADMMMGDNAKATGRSVAFRVRLVGKAERAGGYTVDVIRNGAPFGTLKIDAGTSEATFSDTPAATGRSYYRVQVNGPATPYPQVPDAATVGGPVVALSNPICFNFDPRF